MPLQRNSRQEIDALAKAVVASDAPNGIEFYKGRWFVVDRAIHTLGSDRLMANRSYGEVHGEIWSLIDELITRRYEFQNGRQRRARLEEFVAGLQRPTIEYEVAIEIRYLTLLSGSSIEVGGVSLLHFDRKRARRWRLQNSLIAGDIAGTTAAIVTVQAGSFERARELAEERIDTALAVMRVAMAQSRVLAQIDMLFLQRRGARWAARELVRAGRSTGGWHRGFSELLLDLRKSQRSSAVPMLAAVREFGNQAEPLLNGELYGPLAESLVRALEWMGSSITRESLDDKVVDLCTAMECMLTRESDRLKGQAIALRYLLLVDTTGGGTFVSARAPLWIYEVRSQVIHGARRRAATRAEYEAMLSICMETFRRVVQIMRSRGIRSIRDLIELLESDAARVLAVPQMLLDATSRTDREVLKYATDVAARGRARDNKGQNPSPA